MRQMNGLRMGNLRGQESLSGSQFVVRADEHRTPVHDSDTAAFEVVELVETLLDPV